MAHELGALIDSTRILTIHSVVPHRSTPDDHWPLSALALRQVLARDPKRARAFQELAGSLLDLRHDGLLAVEEVAEQDGRPFAVAPLPPGAPLSRLLAAQGGRTRRFGLEASVRVVLDAARAVQVLHGARPDLRPLGYLSAESLWVTVGGRGVLLPSVRCAPLTPSLSEGPAREWARYRAPECESGGPADERADVYSLAVLLWDLLAAGRPRRTSRDRDATGKSPPWVDVSLVRLVMRSLSTDASARPPDPSAFAAELSRAAATAAVRAGGEGPTSVPASAVRATRVPSPPRLRRPPDETEDAVTIELPHLRPPETDEAFEVAAPAVRLAAEPAAIQTGTAASIPGPPKPTPARLRIVGEGKTPELVLVESARRWVVGRATFADLVVSDPDMSRTHFEVLRDGADAYRVHDLGSKNGLFVNGKAATERQLQPGDELHAGATRLRFEA